MVIPNSICIFGICIPLYGLFVFLGIVAFVVTTTIIILKREKFSKDLLWKLGLIAIPSLAVLYISALVFNSIFHSIEHCSFMIGGITWLGGVLGLLPFLFFMLHQFIKDAYGKEFEFMSLLMPGIVIGHAFGRIGCFFAGCCYGQVTYSGIGVVYPEGSLAASMYPVLLDDGTIVSQPVLPTQLFEAGFELILFLVMVFLPKKTRPYNLEMYCVGYSIFRFVLEFFRADDRGGTGFFLSPSQLMSIILLIGGVLVFLLRKNVIFHKAYEKINYWKDNPPAPKKGEIKEKEDYTVTLAKLKDLYDQGIITEEEYENKKKEILDNIGK